ncbi:antagonist of mitotic exit network 1-like [Lamellibrachia satsuma]|nr:antagonist of mitotic exit network 1-like [Lamellibrachia satsuma]
MQSFQVIHSRTKVLDLSECDIGDIGLSHIASTCKLLIKIDLNSAKASRTAISSEGVCDLAKNCPHLQVVYLRRCHHVTDDAVVAIARRCRQLRELNVGGCCQLTDTSLEALAANHYLTSVNFSRANVTDAGVLRLVSGECGASLKEVHMNNCAALSDEAIEAVMQYCTNITILLFDGCPKLTGEKSTILSLQKNLQS